MGRGNNFVLNEEDDEIVFPACTLPSNDNSIINPNDLDRDYFRIKLVENFSIKLSRGDVYWPRSIRSKHRELISFQIFCLQLNFCLNFILNLATFECLILIHLSIA